jgi:two-component system, NtrC family, nitrogen regulation sensor histidine kinase NtrY
VKQRERTDTTPAGLVSIILLYVVLIVLVLLFARQILTDLAIAGGVSRFFIVLVAIVFPAFLVSLIAVNVVRLLRQRARGRPGARFKTRLLLFFTVVVLLSSVPQGIFAVHFIRTALNSWFGSNTGEALRAGLDLALDYYDDRSRTLEVFSDSRVFDSLMSNAADQPGQTWDTIREVNPTISSFQLFDAGRQEIYSGGDARVFLSPRQVESARVGQIARESTEQANFIRVRADSNNLPEGWTAVLSVRLPNDFDVKAQQLTGAIELFTQLDQFRSAFVVAVAAFFVFFSFPLLLLAILVAFFLSDEIMRPIMSLEEATRRVAEGDYSFRILTRSRDDLGVLVDSFNTMVSELDRSRRKILQTEKVAAWQEIAQRLAHEIKNPLTPIKLSAERMLRKYHQGSEDFERIFEQAVSSIIREVDGLNELLTEFRNFSRLPEPDYTDISVRDLVADAAAGYEAYQGTKIEYDTLDSDLTVPADYRQMKQVVANLFQNALDAMNGRGEILVHASVVRKGNSNYCRIQIQDTGPGIGSEDQTKVFHPYFTTKRHGTGLGLSIVERIVFDHNGQIWFESERNIGTTFFIDLPAERKQ